MDRWRSGDLVGLWEQALKTKAEAAAATDELDLKVVDRVVAAAAKGAKACQVLSEEAKLADLNDDTFRQLEKLHPLGPEVKLAPVEPAPTLLGRTASAPSHS